VRCEIIVVSALISLVDAGYNSSFGNENCR
jgi:hypothetical protein